MKGNAKDSKTAKVRVGLDGRVHKWYRGPLAKERYENEIRVLRRLEEKGCEFVPQVLEEAPEDLYLVTTNCGTRVSNLSQKKQDDLFEELEQYDVRHNDKAERNITYNSRLGRFCLIDFEFATVLSTGEGLEIEDANEEHRRLRKLDRSASSE